MIIRIPSGRALMIALGVGAALTLGMLANSYYVGLVNLVLIAVVAAASQGLLLGWAGQVSLGFAGFFAVGGVGVALLSRYLGVSELLSGLSLAFILGMGAGVLVGAPAVRMQGLYLAVSSLAFHSVILYLVGQYQHSAGGSEVISVPSPTLAGTLTISGTHMWYFVLLTSAGITVMSCSNLGRSRIGRAWKTIGHREIIAAAFGARPFYLKLLAFAVSSGIAAAAGGLDAYYNGFVSQERYSVLLTIQCLTMVVVGGAGSPGGWAIGAVCITLLPFSIEHVMQALPSLGRVQAYVFQIQQAVFGTVLLAVLLLEPGGLIGVWNRIKRLLSRTDWPERVLTEEEEKFVRANR